MKTTQRKLTTLESRASAMCQAIQTNGGKFYFSVIWKRSATWGSIPSIHFRGEKVATASGCGYDKLSAVLADALRFLFDPGSEDHKSVWRMSGVGESSLRDALAKRGWILTRTYNGKTEDGFTIEKVQA